MTFWANFDNGLAPTNCTGSRWAGGDLSVTVRWGGGLDLRLSKSDCRGGLCPADAPMGRGFFNNVSPGHVRLIFGQSAARAATQRFRQRLDLYHGRIVVQAGKGVPTATIRVWGDPWRCVPVVEVDDPAGILGATRVELSGTRETMRVGCVAARLCAREMHTRPARPRLATAGMEDYFPSGRDPLQGRGTAVGRRCAPSRNGLVLKPLPCKETLARGKKDGGE